VAVKSPNEKTISILADEAVGKMYSSQVISPIIAEGDAIGSVIIFSTDPSVKMGEVEMKLADSASGFLGRQMEQ
ncbi:MAG TPA: stage V sporulation T C-terminal domain-containing protein, partial [Clostridia bacterium]|nr:stage V sporulation T C-terminal domain-containing protein [Clostridia bacterium]